MTKTKLKQLKTFFGLLSACAILYAVMVFKGENRKTQQLCPMPGECDSVVNRYYEPLKCGE